MTQFLHLFKLQDAITFENYKEELTTDAVVFLVIGWPQAIAISPCLVSSVDIVESEVDSYSPKARVHVLLGQNSKKYAFNLEDFNGYSSFVGFEVPEQNYNRIFMNQASALEYAESIKFQREVEAEVILGFLNGTNPED